MTQPVKQLSVWWLAATLALLAVSANVETKVRYQPHESIVGAVRDFVLAEHGQASGVKVNVSSLDPRLRLVSCPEPLKVAWAPGSNAIGNTTLGVSCTGRKSWRLYVPARVSMIGKVAVATRPLTRGHRIGPGDLRLEERDLASVRGDVIRDPKHVLGYRLTRAITTNRVISARFLAAPHLVKRGHRVQVLMDVGGLAIRMTGVSLEDGSHGDRVRVRNPVSNRVVEASVVRPGIVRVSHQ